LEILTKFAIKFIQFEDKDYKLAFENQKEILKVCKLLKKFNEERNDIEDKLIDIERDSINGIVLIIQEEKRIAINEVKFEILLDLIEKIFDNISNLILLQKGKEGKK